MSAGQIIIDTNHKIWLRWDKYSSMTDAIHFYSAMTNWQDKLMMGVGQSFSSTPPDLVYLGWDKITEADRRVEGENTITSHWRSKNFDFGFPHTNKQLRKIVIIYRDHPNWTGETIDIYYRINQNASYNVPGWTSLGSITLGQVEGNYQTRSYSIPLTNLSEQGEYFQFELRATGHLEVLRMIIYFHILSERE